MNKSTTLFFRMRVRPTSTSNINTENSWCNRPEISEAKTTCWSIVRSTHHISSLRNLMTRTNENLSIEFVSSSVYFFCKQISMVHFEWMSIVERYKVRVDFELNLNRKTKKNCRKWALLLWAKSNQAVAESVINVWSCRIELESKWRIFTTKKSKLIRVFAVKMFDWNWRTSKKK